MKSAQKRDILKEVKLKLIKQGMTQKQLAEMFGYTRQHLNAVISGRIISEPTMNKVLEWLDED
jgi:transcriptional regulator with XRE-family HTH domain